MIPTSNKTQGFTLLEIVIVVAILALLFAVIAPVAKEMIDDAKVTKILDLKSRLLEAAQRYHLDTGKFPVENSGPLSGPLWAPKDHKLSMDPGGVVVWNGPYIDKPLSFEDHPFGGQIQLLSTLKRASHVGFDLLGDGDLLDTNGSMLVIHNLTSKFAQKVDKVLDGHKPYLTGPWDKQGEVAWIVSSRDLVIFLMADPNDPYFK